MSLCIRPMVGNSTAWGRVSCNFYICPWSNTSKSNTSESAVCSFRAIWDGVSCHKEPFKRFIIFLTSCSVRVNLSIYVFFYQVYPVMQDWNFSSWLSVYCFLQLLVDIMWQLRMGPSIHLSTPMNTLTPKTATGSSAFPMATGFTSTLLYCRLSPSQIILLSGKSCKFSTNSQCSLTDLKTKKAGVYNRCIYWMYHIVILLF